MNPFYMPYLFSGGMFFMMLTKVAISSFVLRVRTRLSEAG